jgi:hypothetical protein
LTFGVWLPLLSYEDEELGSVELAGVLVLAESIPGEVLLGSCALLSFVPQDTLVRTAAAAAKELILRSSSFGSMSNGFHCTAVLASMLKTLQNGPLTHAEYQAGNLANGQDFERRYVASAA